MLSESALNNLKRLAEPKIVPTENPVIQQVKTKEGPVPVKIVQVGSSGTNIYSGYIDEEYLAELKGNKAMKIYDQMRRSDPRIAMVLKAVKNPIKSADWTIRTTQDNPIAERQKELIETILFKGLNKSWKKTLHEILSMVDFGHAEIEVTHKPVLKHKLGSHIGLKSLKLIGQKTVERFNVNKDGDLVSITQYANGDVGKSVDIPAQFILHFAIDKEGDNYEGISMLRTCYGPWLRKNNALKQEAVGNQNASTPIPVMTIPEGLQNTDPQYLNAVTFLENYANNLSSYLMKPTGWELELKNNPFDSSKIRETIKAENEEITFAFLANFLNLASGGGGSYALSNDLSDFFTSSLEFIAEEIVETFNNNLIPALIKMNFPNAEVMVELAVSGIADKAGKEFAEVMELLGRAGMIKPDRDLEEALRKKYKLPAIPDIEVEAEEVKPAGAAGVVDDVQATALNGAQVTSMIEVAKAYTDNILTRESAIAMLIKAFNMTKEDAEIIIPVTPPEPDIKTQSAGAAQFAEKKSKKEKPEQVVARITANAEGLRTLFREGLEPIGKDIIKKLVKSYEAKPDSRVHSAVFDIKPAGLNAYNEAVRKEFMRIAGEARAALESGYKFATPKKSVNRALSKADLLVMTQERDLEKAIFLQFGTSIDSTDSISTLESDLMIAMNNQIKMIEVGADISAAQLENETRMDFFDEISDEVESFTFFNADPISEICQALDGATFAITDPDLERYTPPLHHNCKSVMIPNLKGDKNNPEPTGLPSLNDKQKASITLGEKKNCCDH